MLSTFDVPADSATERWIALEGDRDEIGRLFDMWCRRLREGWVEVGWIVGKVLTTPRDLFYHLRDYVADDALDPIWRLKVKLIPEAPHAG